MTLHLFFCIITVMSATLGLVLDLSGSHSHAFSAYLAGIVACCCAVALVIQ
jgi:hypothetical protein